jgi:glycosyltransferase involved in cell wall biosynthesis
MAKVSVIMNCYNSDKYLRQAIDSIFNQTYTDFEIIFWDNLSTDKSPEIAKSYGEKLLYFRGEQFLPLGAARNEAIKKANGKYIAFLDCDDIWLPHKLEKQVEVMEANPDVCMVYSNLFKKRGLFITPFHKSNQPEGDVFLYHLYGYKIAIPTVMLRTECVREMDTLFDPDLKISNDADMFLRFIYGRKAMYIKDKLAIYRIYSASVSHRDIFGTANEVVRVINKVIKFNELKGNRYRIEEEKIEKKLSLPKAILALAQNDLTSSRKHIKIRKWDRPVCMGIYIISFFPSFVWRFFYSCWKTLRVN